MCVLLYGFIVYTVIYRAFLLSGMNWLLLVEPLITLLIMVNPINVIPSYLSITADLDRPARRQILKQAMVFATLILVSCVFLGRGLLAGLGISTFALQIAGGILFFKFGYEVMTGSLEAAHDQAPGLVPLGFPIIAGPGSITAIILLSTRRPHIELYLVIAILLVLALTFVLLYSAKSVVAILGDDATTAIVKLMGLLVITMGIQLILGGLQSWLLQSSLRIS